MGIASGKQAADNSSTASNSLLEESASSTARIRDWGLATGDWGIRHEEMKNGNVIFSELCKYL